MYLVDVPSQLLTYLVFYTGLLITRNKPTSTKSSKLQGTITYHMSQVAPYTLLGVRQGGLLHTEEGSFAPAHDSPQSVALT